MNIRHVLPIVLIALVAACKQKPADAPATPAATPVATVNGVALDTDLLQAYVQAAAGRGLGDLTAEQRSDAVDALVRLKVFANEAEKQGLQKEKDIAALLDLSRLQVLQSTITRRHLKGKEPTEQELRAEYDVQIAAAPRTDYRVRHILVKSEDFANQVIQKLQKGARFEQVAAADSTDAESKARGGDLGWLSPGSNLPPAFIQAMLGLKKGAYTATPVQTDFGFHIIKVDDTREATMPAFEQVKERLIQIVMQKKAKAYSDELLKVAKIEKK